MELSRFTVTKRHQELALAALAGFGVGATVGYIVAKARAAKHFENELTEALEMQRFSHLKKMNELKRDYEARPAATVITINNPEDVTEVGKEIQAAVIESQGYSSPATDGDQDPEVETELSTDIVEDAAVVVELDKEGLDYAKLSRGQKLPYPISFEEFEENDDYTKETLTYYQQDNTVCDDTESTMDDFETKLGRRFREFFGWRSKDPRVVFIRNDRIQMDFEVCLNEGAYSIEVLGESFSSHPAAPPIRPARKNG